MSLSGRPSDTIRLDQAADELVAAGLSSREAADQIQAWMRETNVTLFDGNERRWSVDEVRKAIQDFLESWARQDRHRTNPYAAIYLRSIYFLRSEFERGFRKADARSPQQIDDETERRISEYYRVSGNRATQRGLLEAVPALKREYVRLRHQQEMAKLGVDLRPGPRSTKH